MPAEPIPHSYSLNEPCVYFPSTEEWRPDMKIATTIIGGHLSGWRFTKDG